MRKKELRQQDILKLIDGLDISPTMYKNATEKYKAGSQFPTSRRDYERAQEGIKNGEERYTNEELELWE